MKAILALEDGSLWEGESFGAEGETSGEVVFNTSLSGYQEILTDPSYKGQIVLMTCSEIGNVGVNLDDTESHRPFTEGFVVREYLDRPSNWRSLYSLGEYMKQAGVVGIQGVDTRAITRRLRIEGAMRGIISTQDLDPQSLVKKAREVPSLVGIDLVKEVTCSEPYEWVEGLWSGTRYLFSPENKYRVPGKKGPKVVVCDFGVKRNILRGLVHAGFSVTVVPALTPARQILDYTPDGILLSNGPGDPAAVTYAVSTTQDLVGKVPILGICLGHQILGLACGLKTYKLKFGHHGGNHPVKDLKTGKVSITAQNHGFAVEIPSGGGSEFEVTEMNCNDQTVEGLKHRRYPIIAAQYHPEASPGPHDAAPLFQKFREMIENA
ncbi:MAG: glutamine-hydrolyzing carbamoyl-phosphate synthase small subunit [Deltaproteobacteria bacterium]|nr:glutamine-hydrolyzing carbamoyl-phosphate synthase small subunit [Deltaproteobacteria bacterium]